VQDLTALLGTVPDFREFLSLEELRASSRTLVEEYPGIARMETVGRSAEGRPIELLTIGHGEQSALLLGVPHPNEPIGTLTLEFLCRLFCENAELRARFDTTLHVVKVADPDGLVLNEGWFKGEFSPRRYALAYYRPPHREQVEWSFPVDYKSLRFTSPTPETAAVMRVMERTRPRFFYSLHNAGFCGVYFYVSENRPDLFRRLHALVEAQGLPLHRGEPEVPYLETLAPAVYRLFGIEETYEYLARTLGEDPAPLIGAGTSSDDWLKRICETFSVVCEVPYYTSPALSDTRPAGATRREAVLAGVARAEALHDECARGFAALAGRAPDHRLTRSVMDYLQKTPKRLDAERANAETPAYARQATRAEAMDATTCRAFYHMLYLGELHRLAAMIGEPRLANEVAGRIAEVAGEIETESALAVLPLRPLVAVQSGVALLGLAGVSLEWSKTAAQC
jgi:zinc carboxypeptidase